MRIFSLFVIVFLMTGCTTIRTSPPGNPTVQSQPSSTPITSFKEASTQALNNVEKEVMQEYVEKKGVVFAKIIFQGILATNYAKLILQQLGKPDQRFQVVVGNKVEQPSIMRRGQNIRSEYFFIELPEGDYKIVSISIPVGTAMASEESNIVFNVTANNILYLGTLKVTGTKERIKLGGIPLIQPGFEYEVEVLDEYKEGIKMFQQLYPDILKSISTKLMKVSTASGKK
jgi:hypothetical protein